ncbi:MAG: TonB-dependent receptor [Bacteroidales bacterium]|nr:TonB-dependent receptor [Bacteroidales bacterium]
MNIRFRLFVSLTIFLLAGPSIVKAQPGRLKILDAITKQPVVFAHVCYESITNTKQKHSLTDASGFADNPCTEPCVVAISYVGYKTLFDTITKAQSKTLLLQPTVLNIDEIVITAQYTPERADKSIYNIKVMNTKQIEYKAATNLSDVMRSELNVRTSQDGVLGSSISLQGLSGENVKLLIDGIPVIGRMNGNIDFSQINLNNVSHIEVIEGPMSVVYGSNALAGVINVITKENKNTRLTSSINSYTESVGVYNVDGGVSVKKNKNIYAFDAGRNFFGGYSDPDTLRSKQWKPKRQVFANASHIYSHDKLKIKTSGQFFNELLLSKGNLIPPYFEKAFDNYFYTNRAGLRSDIATPLGNDRYFNALLSWSWFERRKQTYFKDLTTLDEILTTNSDDQDTSTFNAYTGRFTYSKSIPDHWLNYQTGLDLNHETGSGKRITGTHQEIGDYAAFMSIRVEPVPQLSLQPGIRWSYNTRYSAPLVYSFNAKWSIAENYTIRGSYSKGFRAPSLKELYLLFVDVNHNIRGNEDLEAEHSNNYNLSGHYAREYGKHFTGFDISGFYNNIKNIITLANVNSNLYTYINLDQFTSVGVQANLVYKFYPGLSLKTGVAYTGRKSYQIDQNQSNLKMLYSNDFIFEASYFFPKKDFTASAFYKYTGKLPRYTIDEEGKLSESFIGGYHGLDISLMKRFFQNKLSLSVGAKNLFDVKTVDAAGGTGVAHSGGGGAVPVGWGRSYFVKISVQLSKFE